MPLLLAATGGLLITVIMWAATTIVRRRYALAARLDEQAWRTYLWSRIAALAGVLYMFGWLIAMAADFASIDGSTPWIRLLQLIGLACVAGVAIATLWVWRIWRLPRTNWPARVWSLVSALALLYLAWFSFAFHLISARIN